MKLLKCKCGWKSKVLSNEDLEELGVPWYCDNCGERVTTFYNGTEKELMEIKNERR